MGNKIDFDGINNGSIEQHEHYTGPRSVDDYEEEMSRREQAKLRREDRKTMFDFKWKLLPGLIVTIAFFVTLETKPELISGTAAHIFSSLIENIAKNK